jgi:N-acetylmuramoyl-L-alanine amidase
MNLDWMPEPMRVLVENATEPQRVAGTLWAEARSEPIQGIIGVANVIRNRVRQPQRFGASFSDVVTAKRQFSCWTPLGGEANYKRLLWLMAQFVEGKQITDLGARECVGITQLMLGDYLRDRVRGAVHYHALSKDGTRPKWAMGHTPCVQHGNHLFYRDIP